MKANTTLLTLFLLFSALFSACNDRSADTTEKKLNSSSDESSTPREVVVFTWEEYFSDEVIASFEEESGIKVRFEHYENLGDLMGRLRSEPGAFDVVVIDDVSLAEVVDLKLLHPLEPEQVPNLQNFGERYLDQEFDPGNQFSVPYLWGTTLIAYRSDKIIEPDPSWNLFWNPELKGRTAMMDEKDDVYASALLSLGYDLTSKDKAELSDATKKLIDLAKEQKTSFFPWTSIRDDLITGRCWAAVLYSGDAAMISEEDENIAYFIPKEGAPIWMDNFAIPRNAQNVEEGHRFINFISDGKVAAENANYLWYATPNQEAIPYLNSELTLDESVNPPEEILRKCAFHPRPSSERDRIINQGMKKIFDQVRAQNIANAKIEELAVPEREIAIPSDGDSLTTPERAD